jgi:hypothetical protein
MATDNVHAGVRFTLKVQRTGAVETDIIVAVHAYDLPSSQAREDLDEILQEANLPSNSD